MDALETEYQTALKAEDVATQRAANLAGAAARVAGGGDMPTMPAEFREFMGIEARCEIDGFFDGVQDIETTGAEREMRQALGVYERGVIPWPMLVASQAAAGDPPGATRRAGRGRKGAGADRQGVRGEDRRGQRRVPARRVRQRLDGHVDAGPDHPGRVRGLEHAAFLMTRFSSAPVGDALELVLTSTGAGITADRTARTAAGSLTARTLTPKAIRAVYDINKTALQRFRGLESSLRSDLPRAINDVIDQNVLTGSNFSGSILARTTNPTNPSTNVTFGSGIASLAEAIDGMHARTLKECKLVVNPHTLAFMYSLLASNTAVTLPDYFMTHSGGIMTTANMPVTSARINKAIACKTGPGVQFNGIAKMWGGGIQVVRDEYSLAPENQLIITANVYADYDVVRPAGYLQIEFYTPAP